MAVPIILASSSPFRRALLDRLRLDFTCISPEVDESRRPGETPAQLVKRLSEAKARAVAEQAERGLIIGSDQCAECEGEILGKPGDHARAVEQLRFLSGKEVRFHTGLALLNAQSGELQVDDVLFTVVMRPLRDAQIEAYLQAEQPYNCAGSFKSEALGICLFEAMRGDDPTALIGLPLIRLTTMLETEGVRVCG
ncbi:MAG: Maf family nucleotide pyrophosphatase [Gammaproteobacteria bacterium]|jgi:septum formation protein